MKKFLFFIFMSFTLFADTPIFVLHSYHEGYPWTDRETIGFTSVLNSKEGLYPLYSTEHLDTKRRGYDKSYEKEFVHYMRSKYKGYKPKLIYVTDDDALDFMLYHRKKFFPNVPIVFSGINNLLKFNRLDKKIFTGVFGKKEIIPNIKLIKTLFPQENEILLLGDGSSTSKVIQDDIRQDMSIISSLKIQYVNDKSYELMMNRLKGFKGRVVILATVGGLKTEDDKLVPLKQVINSVVTLGDFIVLSLEDTYIQQGVIGGFANDGISQGNLAGQMALKILENPETALPKSVKNTNNWIFDIKALDQYKIVLPDEIVKQSRILNVPQTFFQKNQSILIILLYVLIAITVLGSLYFARFMHSSRRIILQREEHLASITESMDKAQAIAHLGNWDWDIKNNQIWWSDEVYRIFGLEPQAFKATYEAFLHYVHPDDKVMVQDAVNQALSQKKNYHVTHRIVNKYGIERYVLEEGTLKLDTEGTPLRMIGIIHDITKQIAAQSSLEESEKKYRNLIDNATIGIYRTSLSGIIQYINPALAKMLGYDSVDEVIGKSSLMMYRSPKNREKLIQMFLKKGHVSNYELSIYNKNRTKVPIMLSGTLEDGSLTGMVIDMREIKKSREEVDKLSKVVEQIDDTVLITDKTGTITYVNQAFCDHTGYMREDVLNNTPRVLKSGKYNNNFYKVLWKTILNGDVFKETVINKKKNGDLFYEKKTISPLRDDKNNLMGFVSSGKDVTLETMMHEKIEYIASTDKLTGIYNRHKFEEVFTLEVERSNRFHLPLSLILIDIDYFKSVNDTYGHDIGDDVLKHLAKVIGLNIRKIDVFARWGGEEFLVLGPGTAIKEIYTLAEKLRLAVERARFPEVERITISLGISTFEEDDTFSSLFKRADKSLYFAKENGRNQVDGGMKL